MKPASSSQKSVCLCPLSAGIKGVYYHAQFRDARLCVCVCVSMSMWECGHACGGHRLTSVSYVLRRGLSLKLQLIEPDSLACQPAPELYPHPTPARVLSLAMPFLAMMIVSCSSLPPWLLQSLEASQVLTSVPEGATQEAYAAGPKAVASGCWLSEHFSLIPPTSTPWVEHP